MKKLLTSRMGQMILGVAVVLACLAGMTWWATKMILKNEDLQAYIKKMEVNQEDPNATEVNPPEGLPDATKTPEETVYQENKPKQDERIVSAFQTLNAVTSPGELDFTNPNIAILMSEMRNRWNYLQQREGELNELETHLGEQLQALHYHTNNITRTRNQLDQLFEGRIYLIRREEEARLQEMARIYENLLLPDQPDGPAVVRQILRANLTEDPTLNGKVFQYLAPTNQALVFRTLLSGDTSDPELYQNLTQHHRKTMKAEAIDPKPEETP